MLKGWLWEQGDVLFPHKFVVLVPACWRALTAPHEGGKAFFTLFITFEDTACFAL